jgi:uncharacterized protein (TIGR03086 family)
VRPAVLLGILPRVTWSPDVAFINGLDFFTQAVGRVPANSWGSPSPCAGWSALDVLGHIGFATEFGTKLISGEPVDFAGIPDPPRSAIRGDPAEWWAGLVQPAKEAVQHADLSQELDSPMGRRSIGAGISFPAVDLFVHGWDLTRSVGVDVEIPTEAMDFAHQVIDVIPEEHVRSARVFAAAIDVPPDASPQVQFLAWAGRDCR